jgi:hypothetical protein
VKVKVCLLPFVGITLAGEANPRVVWHTKSMQF